MADKFYFNEECLENVRQYRYLGVYFLASGVWQAKCTIIRETKVYKAKTMV